MSLSLVTLTRQCWKKLTRSGTLTVRRPQWWQQSKLTTRRPSKIPRTWRTQQWRPSDHNADEVVETIEVPEEALEHQTVEVVEMVEVVVDEHWVPSTHRPWTGPATFTINLVRKPGHVPIDIGVQ